MTKEQQIEESLITRLTDIQYIYRPDIRNREALEQNFRDKFEALNKARLTDTEFARLLDSIISPDVFACSETLRNRNTFERDDGTPLHFQLVNLKDWCKNSFEVINQLRINTCKLRREEERHSRRVSMEEIEENDFNLNITRYVSTAKPEEPVDLQQVHGELTSLADKITKATERHNTFLKELGLPILPLAQEKSRSAEK